MAVDMLEVVFGTVPMPGNFHLAGTPNYFDPILFKQFMKGKRNPSINYQLSERIDLYLADVYSLGLTFYKTLIG